MLGYFNSKSSFWKQLRLLAFADLGGGFADQVAEVLQRGTASEASLFDFDFDDDGSIEWEDLLDTDTA